VIAARGDEKEAVVFVGKIGDAGSTPGVYFAVNEDDSGVVKLEEAVDGVIHSGLVEREGLAEAVREHDVGEITFGMREREAVEALCIVAVIAHFGGGLDEERLHAAFGGKVVGAGDRDEMVEERFVVSTPCGNGLCLAPPLPESKRVFQDTEVEELFPSDTESQPFLEGVITESFDHHGSSLEDFVEESANTITFPTGTYVTEKLLVAPVFGSAVERSDVGYGKDDVVREPSAVEQSGLPTFADAGADPFVGVKRGEEGTDVVKVGGGVFGGEVSPVEGIWL
jgi:hypothetical protein